MKLKEIENAIKNYRNIIATCKRKGLHKAGEYYKIKLKILETERKELLKIKESA